MPSRRTAWIAAGIAVAFQVTLASGTSARRNASDACVPRRSSPPLPCSSSAGRRARGPDVADAVHPGLARRLQLVVAVDPLRVVGREHVRLDPERRQVGGELERPLDAAAARGRPVHRDDEDAHYWRRYRLYLASCQTGWIVIGVLKRLRLMTIHSAP